MMVFDVDRLKEALDSWSIDPAIPGDGLNHKQRMRIAAAVRLVVAGQTLWWCEEHGGQDAWEVEGNGEVAGYCIAIIYSDEQPIDTSDCRMVERWLSPTGPSPTGPSPAKPTCSHGFNKPHSVGGTTNFHYDVATVCDEWVVERGLATDKLKVSPTGKDET